MRVQLVDADPARADIAEALGVDFALPEDAAGRLRPRRPRQRHRGRDSPAPSNSSPPEGTVLELSWYGDRRVSLPLGEAFHSRRLVVRSSQVGTVSPAGRAGRTYADRLALALDLLADPAFDALITGECAFEELPEVLPRLASGELPALCHRVRCTRTDRASDPTPDV